MIAALGGGVVLLLAILVGVFMARSPKAPKAGAEANVAAARLQIDQGKDDKPNPAVPLRCFVGGQFVGQFTLADCARKNGLSAQALDVGLDPATGQVAAAATDSPMNLRPLTPDRSPQPLRSASPEDVAAASGECMRYAGDAWRTVAPNVTAQQCMRSLFENRCARAGEAVYGRWNGQVLRLVPGKVEISSDNRSFRTMMMQDSSDCAGGQN